MSDVTQALPQGLPAGAATTSGVRPARNAAMLVFVTISLFLSMWLQQTVAIERGSWQYFAYLAISIGLPLLSLRAIVGVLFGRAMLLFLFLLLAGSWQIAMGDIRAAVQLILLVMMLAWVASDRAGINVGDLSRLYLALVGAGAVILLLTDYNAYSLVPGRSAPDFGIWRVSFFPNIAYTGILSLALLLVLTIDAKWLQARPFVSILVIYFLALSAVRAALISVLIYLLLRFWFSRWGGPRPRRMFWISLAASAGFVVATALSVEVLYQIQGYPFVSALLLRGETDISTERIAYQLYRPWLWNEQWRLFTSSPYLMGWGSADFQELVSKNMGEAPSVLISGGSEALPTRLLFAFGLPASLFVLYLIVCLRRLAFEDDRWACACFPALFSLMMTWGSVFHPTDGLFVILMLIMIKGRKGFTMPVSQAAGK